MRPPPTLQGAFSTSGSPFLPLAFRLATAFVLLVIQLGFPGGDPIEGEAVYLTFLFLFLLESFWEAGRSLTTQGNLFATPSRGWIHLNLVLDILLVALLTAFHGVELERLVTIYIFPVLASAFYLTIPEIVGVGVLTLGIHTATVAAFATGLLPAFGRTLSGQGLSLPGDHTYLLGFATLLVLGTTLIVVLIRKHLETLGHTLRRSEAAMDELSALYLRVFESMYAGLVTLDLTDRITSANPAAEAILRRPLPLGADAHDLELVESGSLPTLATERRFERTFTTPEGQARIMGGTVAPIRDSAGQIRGHLLLFQDLTDLKLLEERTRLSERMATVGGLAASLAHELRNPMASILGCVQLLRRDRPSPVLLDRALAILQREGERVSGIVTDFLEFARPRDLQLQALWLPSVIEDVVASWDTDPRAQDIPLTCPPVPALWVSGDPLTFHQVFTNLLSNARKAVAGRRHPVIRLAFLPSTDRVSLQVIDNGCGMTPEQLDQLYLPFATGFQEGTGLGMSLVYRFTQQMDWTLHVTSEADVGTTVTLGVPLTDRGDVPALP